MNIQNSTIAPAGGDSALNQLRGLAAARDVTMQVIRDFDLVNGRHRRPNVNDDPAGPYNRMWNRWWSDGSVAMATEHDDEVTGATWLVRDQGARAGRVSYRDLTVYLAPGAPAGLEEDLMAHLRAT